jgi:hypothetical protein
VCNGVVVNETPTRWLGDVDENEVRPVVMHVIYRNVVNQRSGADVRDVQAFVYPQEGVSPIDEVRVAG